MSSGPSAESAPSAGPLVESARPSESPAGAVRTAVEWLAILVLYALLNRFSERFQVVPFVSILFLPTAVAVVGGYRLGFAAVPAIILATFLSPWADQKQHPYLTLAFGVVNSVEAVVPVLLARIFRPFDRKLSDGRSILIFIAGGLVLNTGLEALLGNLLRQAASPAGAGLAGRILVWWIADLSAALIFATPILLLWPGTTSPSRRDLLRDAFGEKPVRILGGLAAAAIVVAESQVLGVGLFHWFALLFLIPVLDASLRDGFRPGVVTASAASVLYLAAMLVALPLRASPLSESEALVTIYLNTLVFFASAAITGWLSNQRRRLIADLDARNRALRDDFFRIVATLSAAIEARDRATVGHVYRVARTAVEIGRRLGLSAEQLEEINYSAILHDVGKFGIPDRILLKSGRLEAEERALVKSHGAIGAEILQNVDILRPVVAIVLHHQDRFDGANEFPPKKGAPARESGEKIPLGARIIAVADAYDALTSERPYRKAMPRNEAIEILRGERARQFDPRIVDTFLELLKEKGDIPRGIVPVGVAEV